MNVGAFPATGAFSMPNVAGILLEKRFVVANSQNPNTSIRDESFCDDFFTSPESQRRIDLLTIGIALVGPDQRVLCANKAFSHFLGHGVSVGDPFYGVLGDSEIEGPDYCPFASVRHTGKPTVTSVRIGMRVFELTFSPNAYQD